MDKDNQDEIMTVAELAAFLRLRENTIYELAAAGKIPCLRIGKSVRFSKSAVLRWASGQDRSGQVGEQ